jgi:raffinose/stachyose/melibiose transport system permease protein
MKKKDIVNYLAVFLFLLPALALFIGILIAPIIKSAYYSLFDWNGMGEMTFLGLANYKELFTSKAIGFIKALGNACILAALSVFIQLPVSLALALALGRGIKGEKPFLSVYFMPVLISTVVIGQLWLKIYNPDYGLLNSALTKIGLENLCHIWLGDKKTALLSVFVPTLWQYVGYHMLLMYAGVKGVSPDIREAAKIDGATEGQVNRYVVIPAIKPIIKVSIIFAITGSLKSYDLIKVFAKDAYNCSYKVPSLLLVRYAFHNAGGIASAIAVIMIIMCFGFAILINWLFKERDPYGRK